MRRVRRLFCVGYYETYTSKQPTDVFSVEEKLTREIVVQFRQRGDRLAYDRSSSFKTRIKSLSRAVLSKNAIFLIADDRKSKVNSKSFSKRY